MMAWPKARMRPGRVQLFAASFSATMLYFLSSSSLLSLLPIQQVLAQSAPVGSAVSVTDRTAKMVESLTDTAQQTRSMLQSLLLANSQSMFSVTSMQRALSAMRKQLEQHDLNLAKCNAELAEFKSATKYSQQTWAQQHQINTVESLLQTRAKTTGAKMALERMKNSKKLSSSSASTLSSSTSATTEQAEKELKNYQFMQSQLRSELKQLNQQRSVLLQLVAGTSKTTKSGLNKGGENEAAASASTKAAFLQVEKKFSTTANTGGDEMEGEQEQEQVPVVTNNVPPMSDADRLAEHEAFTEDDE
ncbi:unnamed protein product [Amoebophrya sp. A120]|nr:unnamed protein product [Amoebophrya sp. A120]|eukprot:GSA120T00015659001.1